MAAISVSDIGTGSTGLISTSSVDITRVIPAATAVPTPMPARVNRALLRGLEF